MRCAVTSGGVLFGPIVVVVTSDGSPMGCSVAVWPMAKLVAFQEVG